MIFIKISPTKSSLYYPTQNFILGYQDMTPHYDYF